MDRENLYISQGTRPLWHRILAAASFTVTLVVLYILIKHFSTDGKFLQAVTFLGVFSFMSGLRFSLVYNYHFDFKKRRYKIEKCVGPIGLGKWQSFEKLGYVAVFNKSIDLFEVNLWYDGNNHFTISRSLEASKAMEVGTDLAIKLGVDLLDATGDAGESFWVDLD